jgi:hypothetical protein
MTDKPLLHIAWFAAAVLLMGLNLALVFVPPFDGRGLLNLMAVLAIGYALYRYLRSLLTLEGK